MKFTYKDWRVFKKEMGLTNQDVADIIKAKKHTVDVATSPKHSRGLPKWALLAIWVYYKLNKPHQSTGVSDISDSTEGKHFSDDVIDVTLPQLIKQAKNKEQVINYNYPCGCRLNGKLFTRADSCKLDRKAH